MAVEQARSTATATRAIPAALCVCSLAPVTGAAATRATLCLSRKLRCLYGNKEFMVLPARTKYLVVGAGLHGLSTAYHLGTGARGPRPRLRRRHRDPREVAPRRRRVRHRLRRRAQQLLPARHAGAHAGLRRGLGVRSGRVLLQPRRLHGDRAAGAGGRPHGRLRAPAEDRLRLDVRHGRGRVRHVHEEALPGLARQGRDRRPARAQGRLRAQPRLGGRHAGQGRVDRRAS